MRLGGAETALARLALATAQAGHRVEVVALKGVGEVAAPLLAAGIPVTGLKAPDRPSAQHLAAVASLAAYLRRHPADVLHGWLATGCAALQLAATPGVPRLLSARVTDLPPLPVMGILRARTGAPTRWTAVSRAVAVTWACALRVPRDQVEVVPNGVDPGPEPVPEPPGARPLFVGRLTRQKGVDVLLRAVAACGGGVDIVGAGDQEAALRDMAVGLGLRERARFLGRTSGVREAYDRASVVVLPSRAEGMPNVVLEAMAAGRPVVATNVPGTDEVVVPGETGLLVPPEDACALAEALGDLAVDPARRARMGRAGRTRVLHRFRHQDTVERTLVLYAKLQAARATGR
jgi:glycosyltransferase involved in cell wall biosynthesis